MGLFKAPIFHLTININFPPQQPPTDGGVLGEIKKGIDEMSAELDTLTTEVAETGTVVDSAIALIGGLAQQIRDLADDPAALAALASELDAKTNALAAAVSANTTEDDSGGTGNGPPGDDGPGG